MAAQELTISFDRFAASGQECAVHSCTILVACSNMCRANLSYLQMQLDGDSTRQQFLAAYPLSPLSPPPGTHTLKIFTRNQAISTQFSCAASEPLYLISTAYVRTVMPAKHLFWPSSKLSGEVRVEKHLPAELKDSGVLLWSTGRWLVDEQRCPVELREPERIRRESGLASGS